MHTRIINRDFYFCILSNYENLKFLIIYHFNFLSVLNSLKEEFKKDFLSIKL